jgi:hypothetical protein
MTHAHQNEAGARPAPAVPVAKQEPARSLLEQIVDNTVETLGAPSEITATARKSLRQVLLDDQLPGAAEIVVAVNKEDTVRANP